MTFKWFARYWIFCYNVNKHDDVINIAEIRDQLGSLALADINTSVRTPKPKHPNSTNLPLELQNKSPVAFTKLKLGWRRRRKYMVNASPKPCWPKGKSTPNSGGIQTTYPCLQGPLSQTRPNSALVRALLKKYENLHSKCYKPPEANKRPFQQSTICSTVLAWNALTEEQIKLPYSQFKRQLSNY